MDAASNALRLQLVELADLERGIKEFRLSLEPWAVTYAAVLNRAAVACENADSTPATLVSGGWDLRRPPGPPQEMTEEGGRRGLLTSSSVAAACGHVPSSPLRIPRSDVQRHVPRGPA